MNYLFLFQAECAEEEGKYTTAVVSGERLRYVSDLHAMELGDEFPVIIESFGIAKARCERITSSEISFCLFDRTEQAPSYLPVTLLQGICRPQTLKKVLQCAAMFRIEKVIFFPSVLGEKSYRQSKMFQYLRQQAELVKGAEQVGNAYLPKVEVLNSITELWSDLSASSVRMVGEPGASSYLVRSIITATQVTNQFPEGIVLAIGPEAGWDIEELESFKSADFKEVSVGHDHFRVEVALHAMLGQLLLWKEVAGSSLISE